MDSRTRFGALLLLLLLGFSTAHQDMDPGSDNEILADKADSEDITAAILRLNSEHSEFLFEGDLSMPETRNSLRCLSEAYSCFWPKSANGYVEIPFNISSKYDNKERQSILTAMADIEYSTCVRFVQRSNQRGYLSIEPKFGCYSTLGPTGGKQVVSLQRFGCLRHGIIQHELLHALGFYHEHTRDDRDHYVEIIWDNIHKFNTYNFQKKLSNYLDTPYDYSSVMHYGRTAFGRSGAETIIPIPDSSVPIGQRDGLSDIDVLRINRLYKCWN